MSKIRMSPKALLLEEIHKRGLKVSRHLSRARLEAILEQSKYSEKVWAACRVGGEEKKLG